MHERGRKAESVFIVAALAGGNILSACGINPTAEVETSEIITKTVEITDLPTPKSTLTPLTPLIQTPTEFATAAPNYNEINQVTLDNE